MWLFTLDCNLSLASRPSLLMLSLTAFVEYIVIWRDPWGKELCAASPQQSAWRWGPRPDSLQGTGYHHQPHVVGSDPSKAEPQMDPRLRQNLDWCLWETLRQKTQLHYVQIPGSWVVAYFKPLLFWYYFFFYKNR